MGGSYTGRSKNINSQKTVNLFPVVDNQEAKTVLAMYGTPGLKDFCALESEGADTCVRGLWEMAENAYAVVGSRVYAFTKDGVATLLGTIGTDKGPIYMADNGIQVIIVDDSALTHYVEGNVLHLIADPNFPNPVSATTFQDGYIIVTEKNTGKFYISPLYNVASGWSALDFATAEGDPDYAVRVVSANRELWVFGQKTVEVFWNSGNADFPFERIQGSMMEIGVAADASVTKINETLFWLNDALQVVRNNGYQYQVVSTPTLDYQIASYAVISDARGHTCTIEGHSWYVLTFPTEGHTWVYDIVTQYWFEWESYNNKSVDNPWGRHRGNCRVRFDNKEIIGDYENGKLYQLDMDTFTDNGETIRRIRAAQFVSKDRVNVIWHELEIEFEAGVGLVEPESHSAEFTVNGTTLTAYGHGLEYGMEIIISGTSYYVVDNDADTLEVSNVPDGSPVTIGADGTMSWITMMNPQVCLDWSDDGGVSFGNEHWRSIGQAGQRKNRSFWRKMGMSRSRVIRLTITDPVKVVILAAYANLESLNA